METPPCVLPLVVFRYAHTPQELAKELKESLFKAGSPQARRLKVRTNHQHVIIQGGRWSQEVQEWLKARGF
ncbi:hypothetical protein NMY22_g18531 [Coprinellus aureogranulatus]|nr:hypothetical protein NMY22_g18531 [Coprinellus aureogranulatus]